MKFTSRAGIICSVVLFVVILSVLLSELKCTRECGLTVVLLNAPIIAIGRYFNIAPPLLYTTPVMILVYMFLAYHLGVWIERAGSDIFMRLKDKMS